MKIRLIKQFGSNAPGAILESAVIGEGVADALMRVGKAEAAPEEAHAPEPIPHTKSVTAQAVRATKTKRVAAH